MQVKKLLKHFKPLSYLLNQNRIVNYRIHTKERPQLGRLQNNHFCFSNLNNIIFKIQKEK